MVNVAAEKFAGSHWNDPGFNFGTDERHNKVLHKIQGVGTLVPEVLELINHQGIVEKVKSLLGVKEIHAFGTKFFPMLPGQSSVGWHQDNYYFGTQSDRIISCAIYLEPTTPENGCFRIVPSSHKIDTPLKHSPGVGVWSNGEWIDPDEVSHILSGPEDVPCELPGTVVLFSSLLVHSAHHNTSLSSTRYSLFWHYIDGALNFEWRGIDFSFGKYKDRHLVVS